MKIQWLSNRSWSLTAIVWASLVCVLASSVFFAAEAARPSRFTCSLTAPARNSSVASPVEFNATLANGVGPYTFTWKLARREPLVVSTTNETTQSVSHAYAAGRYVVTVRVVDSRRKRAAAVVRFTVSGDAPAPLAPPSINSTSLNADASPAASVTVPAFATNPGFRVLAANDLGMHCGDLDHRIASILPPFNVVHAQVVRKGALPALPQVLTDLDSEVVYSAASNVKDPALLKVPTAPVYKTNFWDVNARTGNVLAFDAYNPFYPPTVLGGFDLRVDRGLPVPDLAQLYPPGGGLGPLVASQQDMPGIFAPYSANFPQSFNRFDADLPFFINDNFPIGFRLTGVNWFSAEGIPATPFDDAGRSNPYPLMRVQAAAAVGNSLGQAAGTVLSSLDTVLPVAAEADCYRCHTSSGDGGNGEAACIQGVDANCNNTGSRRSGRGFQVAVSLEDTSAFPPAVKREWAADLNIIRLHDAKHSTNLEAATPVVCQKCHYSPALDLAHLGPVGTDNPLDEPGANGREQRVHQSNSRLLHTFHGQMTDLFPNDMPSPTSPERFNAALGKPQVNAFVLEKLDRTCYQCHPGRETQCLRGRMFRGGLICQDCHGSMLQVGDDFSETFSRNTPYSPVDPVTRRVPWGNEPGCQSCHTGDALDNLRGTPGTIAATDGIRLLQAYRTTDAAATPIVATNRRFAENQTVDGKQVLYRFSKGHGGIFCEGCHGSTHAEWFVAPGPGQTLPNDNVAAVQLQGQIGHIIRCTVCHGGSGPPVTPDLALNGPHGVHVLLDPRWSTPPNPAHRAVAEPLEAQNYLPCQACHGTAGEGTILSNGTGCAVCHENPIAP
ncbi:MAG: PKD domain-containing protein [Syntrophobacteraceae bacterium]